MEPHTRRGDFGEVIRELWEETARIHDAHRGATAALAETMRWSRRLHEWGGFHGGIDSHPDGPASVEAPVVIVG